jgi:arsenite methyltransferase
MTDALEKTSAHREFVRRLERGSAHPADHRRAVAAREWIGHLASADWAIQNGRLRFRHQFDCLSSIGYCLFPMTADEILREEFNRWAEDGRGEEMEAHHRYITEQTIRHMDLHPGERVLDLGCGTGWATRLLARLVGEGPTGSGQVVGLDVSDEMVRRARAQSKEFENVMYVWGSADKIPWQENYFDKVLSVESFYYYPDQERALAELFRVMAPQGKLFILINLYTDNHYSLRWVKELKVPVHVRSEAEYVELIKQHGFGNVEALRIPDQTPSPETYSGKWFANVEELRDFKKMGAVLLMAQKT